MPAVLISLIKGHESPDSGKATFLSANKPFKIVLALRGRRILAGNGKQAGGFCSIWVLKM